MRNAILAMAALVAVAAAAPRQAHACGRGGGSGGVAAAASAAIALGVLDSGLLLFDGGSALASHQPSAGYAVFESIVAVPQLALGIYGTTRLLTSGSSSDMKAAPYALIYTLAMGALTAHAVWIFGRPDAPEETAASDSPLRAIVAVAPTYVPVGEMSHAGVGLVGRF